LKVILFSNATKFAALNANGNVEFYTYNANLNTYNLESDITISVAVATDFTMSNDSNRVVIIIANINVFICEWSAQSGVYTYGLVQVITIPNTHFTGVAASTDLTKVFIGTNGPIFF
jgi:hypothetical protein